MVRINLLKTASRKGANLPGFRIPVKLITGVTITAALAAAVYFGMPYLPKKQQAQRPAPVVRAPTSFTPSTYKKTDIVEDVVREVATERAAGTARRPPDQPYEDLSFLEKVNFEVLFAKNIVELLNRAIPQGIGLKSLEVDNFQTIYAVGLGATRDIISSTFIALKSEKIELLPQPFSYITSNDGDGYRFVVTCRTRFGLDLSDPFQASDRLPARADIPLLIKKISDRGEAAGVKWSDRPLQFDAEKISVYRRFHYRYRGTAAYADFVKFIQGLYADRVPCAFKKVDMKALNESTVEIETQVVFTVRE